MCSLTTQMFSEAASERGSPRRPQDRQRCLKRSLGPTLRTLGPSLRDLQVEKEAAILSEELVATTATKYAIVLRLVSLGLCLLWGERVME